MDCGACWSWFPRRSAIDAEAAHANDGGMSSTSESSDVPPAGDRREFLKSAACVALGGACLLAPAATGVYVLLAPLGILLGGRRAPDGLGLRLEVRGCDLWTFRDGKVVRKDSFWKIRTPPA